MKKSLSVLALSMFFSAFCFGQTVSITFQVSNPDSTPVYVFGSWNGWTDWPGTPMTSVGGGVYSATLTLAQSTTFEYLFVNGVGPTKEVLDPAWSCTNGNGQYTNRVLNVGTSNQTVCSNWSSCSACGTISNDVTYTFQVNAPDSTPVYLFGSWNNWFWPGTPMTAIGGGKYSVGVPLTKGTAYEYLFVNGNAPTKEVLDPAWSCTNGNGQYTNRTVMVGQNDSLICKDWESCSSCNSSVPTDVNVTFRVESPDSTPVYVFGSWSNWTNWPGNPMTSIGNNVYQVVMSLPVNQSIEYLFVNGVGPTKEILDPAAPCTNGNAQYTNRTATIGISDIMLCGVWETCQTCTTVGVHGLNNDKIEVQISKQGLLVLSDDISAIDRLEVYDVLGRTVYFSDNQINVNNIVPVAFNANSVYFIRIKANGQSHTFKGLIIND